MTVEIIVAVIGLLSAVVGAVAWYFRGRDERRDALARSAEALADAEITQRQRETQRMAREREIAVPDPDGSRTQRLLGSWPDRPNT